MAYLKLNKSCMIKEDSLKREFLETGYAGVICNSSVHCLHTRKYHGLFIYEDSGIDGEFHSLLSNLEIVAEREGKSWNIGGYYYPGTGTPGSAGFNRNFSVSPVSTIASECGDFEVVREFLVDSRLRRMHMRIGVYGKGRKSVKLTLRPYLTFRNLHHLNRSNMECSTRYKAIEKGIAVRLYGQYPELQIQLSRKNDYIHAPDWYYNAEYPREMERGYGYQEDLFVPGYFEVSLKPEETVIFSAGIDDLPVKGLARRFTGELEAREEPENYSGVLKDLLSSFSLMAPVVAE